MSENAVAEPLSGSEIIEAIVHKLREQLARNCFLNSNSAYEFFYGVIEVRIAAVDCGRQALIDTKVVQEAGNPSALDSGEGYNVESTETIHKAPPNVVRRETNQDVPITVSDGTGKTESKRVKYQRQEKPAEPSKGIKTPATAVKQSA